MKQVSGSRNTRLGFTLVEMLVVIAIIGILASIILASVSTAKAKGNDTKRVSDIKQIQLALELYNDANNGYPGVSGLVSASNLASDLVPSDISAVPTDPTYTGACGSSGSGYCYESTNGEGQACTASVCDGYVIQADLQTNAATGTTGSAIPSGVACSQSGSDYYYCQTN